MRFQKPEQAVLRDGIAAMDCPAITGFMDNDELEDRIQDVEKALKLLKGKRDERHSR